MPVKTEITSTYTLDSTDLAILRELQKNARLTLKELAEKVNLSTTPVYERWKRLEQLGYISQYITKLDPEKFNQNFTVFCMVKLRRLNYFVAEKFVNSVIRLPEVTEVHHISGDYDYMLKIIVPSIKAYKEFILSVLGHLDPVGSIESHFVMEVLKHTHEFPLE